MSVRKFRVLIFIQILSPLNQRRAFFAQDILIYRNPIECSDLFVPLRRARGGSVSDSNGIHRLDCSYASRALLE